MNQKLRPSPIWSAQQLADYLGVKISWVYQRSGPKCTDKIPRCPGIGVLRFNTTNPAFLNWLERQVGEIDLRLWSNDIDSSGSPE